MRRALAAIAILAATPAAAVRVVDYTADDATVSKWAVEQGVALADWPARSTTTVAVEFAPGVDHDVVSAGIGCSAYKIANPITQLIRRGAAAWGTEATAANAALLIRVDRAATLSRCVTTGELKGSCIYRVTLVGTATSRAPGAPEAGTPFRYVTEKQARAVGACAGLTRGIHLVSREAVAAMFTAAAAPPAVATVN